MCSLLLDETKTSAILSEDRGPNWKRPGENFASLLWWWIPVKTEAVFRVIRERYKNKILVLASKSHNTRHTHLYQRKRKIYFQKYLYQRQIKNENTHFLKAYSWIVISYRPRALFIFLSSICRGKHQNCRLFSQRKSSHINVLFSCCLSICSFSDLL